ncbi:hypothetical protein FOPG_10543 [Fusarium oxysporum f. sp. conglutinans race 2 54008]|uniref:Uncharacterized protein n=1 Tax=Fusarium oxysporum f. sp. conglutinans race 2 54008 TaxID=1089457 RepID=X0IMF0_FUSOX|nr:hypothetical protein FOPG_10543 [Fusarium oxysporum f. sp. conglutinans race 2 54008]KAK2689124.1 hypothetical protein QWA68_011652 [Fusarium oxysporum]
MRKRRLKHRCAVWLLVEKGKRLSAHQQRDGHNRNTRSPTGERVEVIDEALVFTRAPRFRRPHRSHDGQHQLRCSVTPLDFVTECPARAVIMLSLRSILGGLKLDHDLASTYSDTRVFPLPLLVLGYLQALVQA